ncbi:F-box protein At5g03100-like isoform X2 [Euphorbia lathyris]|uniref:F-box protein At5g03100-like isoform X2 n=1 Tax=Euphorbia lathyris TaxID=212925 RepID=UPI003313E2A1
MAGTGGASMVESEGSDVRRCDSENGNKRIKYAEEEDRISTLPDFLIQRILSFLPATDLVKTLVLSKLWKCQWTQVPVLKFVPNHGMSADQFSNFIDKTLSLHDCSNLEKFVINLKSFAMADRFPDLEVWIHFAVRKDVKELVVNFNDDTKYLVPEFLLDTYSLVKLKLSTCNFMENGIEEVNWKYLKSLNLYDCDLGDDTIENVLCCTPLLEYLELSGCDMFQELVIASKSLKTLILDGVRCECNYFEISSPNLERLRISGLVWFTTLKLMNLTSSVNVTLDFYFDMEELEGEMSHDDYINLVQQTLRQVEHVEKLEIGRWLMEILSTCKEDGDCIGGLPDSFIHRIISFFPSTKDAFESDLYKTWKLKWTDAPVPNFVSNEKFVMNSRCYPLVYLDPRLSLWIRLAARKDVKELILDCDATMVDSGDEYPLPQFLFNNSSLVTMKICACDFVPNEKLRIR